MRNINTYSDINALIYNVVLPSKYGGTLLAAIINKCLIWVKFPPWGGNDSQHYLRTQNLRLGSPGTRVRTNIVVQNIKEEKKEKAKEKRKNKMIPNDTVLWS